MADREEYQGVPQEDVHLEVLASGPIERISETKRFAILVLGSFGCICCSFSYAFNLVSTAMQDRYGLTQRDLSTISTVGLVFQYFVLPYAFLFDHFGPLPIAIIATVMFPLGTLLLALCFMDKIKGSVAILSVFNALMALGCSLFDLCCVVTVILHFPTNKGPVTALLKTFTGLGSAIVGSMKLGFFDPHTDNYFFFLMALAIVIGILIICFLKLPEYHLTGYQMNHMSEEEKARRHRLQTAYLKQEPPFIRFVYGFTILIILIIYLPLTSALTAYLKLGKSYKTGFAVAATVLTLLFLAVALPLEKVIHLKRDQRNNGSSEEATGEDLDMQVMGEENVHKKDPSLDEKEPYEGVQADGPAGAMDGVVAPVAAPVETEVDFIAPQYQEPFSKNFFSINLWALWWTLFAIVGAEFVIIFNANALISSLGGEYPDSSLTTLLSVLNGVGSAVGRLAMSYFEAWTVNKKAEERVPITISLFFPTCSVIITIVLFLVLPKAALPLPYVIAALGNGFLAAVIILVTRTIYAKDPAKHYNFCFLASMLASLVLNRFLFGEWYAVQAEKDGNLNGRCYKKRCSIMPLCVLLGLACTAFISDFFVHIRYSRFCKRVLAERARLREEAAAGAYGNQEGQLDGL